MQNKTTKIIALIVLIVVFIGALFAYKYRDTLKGLFSGAAGGPLMQITNTGACHDPQGKFEIIGQVTLHNASPNGTAHNVNLTLSGLPDGITPKITPPLPADIGPLQDVVVIFEGLTDSNSFSIRGTFTWDEGGSGFNDSFVIPCSQYPTPYPTPVGGGFTCTPATQTIQVNGTASFTSNAPATSIWSAPGGNPATGTGSSFSTSYSTAGTKTVTVQDQSSTGTCTVVVTDVPYPTPYPTPYATPSGALVCSPANQTVVAGHAASFSATGGNGTYTWTALGGTPDSGPGATFSTTYGSAGDKTVKVSDGTSQATCAVHVTPLPALACSPLTQTRGINQKAPLTATGGDGTYSWSMPGATIPTATGAGVFPIYLTEGTKTVTVTSAGDSFNCTVIITASTPEADLSLTKSASVSSVDQNNTFTYSLTLLNSGPSSTDGVVVKDTLPSGIQLISASTQKGTFDSASATWNVGTMASGESAGLLLTVKAVAVCSQVNVAEVTASSVHDPDSTPNNHNALEDDQASVSVNVAPCGGGGGPSPENADLSLTKSVNISNPAIGQQFIYTLTLNNAGPFVADLVVVKDLLPSGIVYVSHTASQGTFNPTTGDWQIGTVAVGQNAQLQITATASANGTFVNTGEVTASSKHDPDSTPNNHNPLEDDQASVVIVVGGGGGGTPPTSVIDLSMTKTVDNSQPKVGSQITYTVYLNNAGPNTATGVQAVDLLPSSLKFISANPSQGSYDAASGIWTVGTLSAGTGVALQLTVKVLTADNIINITEVTAADQPDIDSTPNNHNPNEDDYAQVSIASVPGPTLVNAGSGTAAGMIGFGLICLLLAFVIRFRFRSSDPEFVGAAAKAQVTTLRRY